MADVLPTVDSATTALPSVSSVRCQCLRELEHLVPGQTTYLQELESRMFDLSGRPTTYQHLLSAYYRKFIQLVYNLREVGADLLRRYTPSELVHLSEADLNPRVKAEREYMAEQHRLYKKILAEGIDMEGDEDEATASTTKCSKCHATKNISINLRQLRSADEPMSVFYTCNKCGHHWRVG